MLQLEDKFMGPFLWVNSICFWIDTVGHAYLTTSGVTALVTLGQFNHVARVSVGHAYLNTSGPSKFCLPQKPNHASSAQTLSHRVCLHHLPFHLTLHMYCISIDSQLWTSPNYWYLKVNFLLPENFLWDIGSLRYPELNCKYKHSLHPSYYASNYYSNLAATPFAASSDLTPDLYFNRQSTLDISKLLISQSKFSGTSKFSLRHR